MGIVGVVTEVKKVHPKDLTIINIGKFFYAYGKDAYILSYIFKYKILMYKKLGDKLWIEIKKME